MTTKTDEFDPDAPTWREEWLRAKRGAPIQEAHGGHYFGAWPPDGQRALSLATPETAKLIAAMEAKYPGSDWKQLANLDPALAPIAAGEVDDVMGRFGKDAGWKFQGVRTPAHGGHVLAEVKHVDGTDGSAVFLPIDHWGSAEHMQHLWSKERLNPKWSVSSQEPTWQGYARSIIAHEMGHEFMGLNLHLRLGPDRNAPVRLAIEPWLAKEFWPNYSKAHISQYGRHNAHEAWAELWAAALGYGNPKDEQGYHTTLAGMLGQYYPIPGVLKEALDDGQDEPVTIDAGGGSGWACGWAQRHPDISALTGITGPGDGLAESWDLPADPSVLRSTAFAAAGLTDRLLADRIARFAELNAAAARQPGVALTARVDRGTVRLEVVREGHAGHFFGHWTGRHQASDPGAHRLDSADADPQHTKEHTSMPARMRFVSLAKAFPAAGLRLADGTVVAAEEALRALEDRALPKARRRAILQAIQAKMTAVNDYDPTPAIGNVFSGGGVHAPAAYTGSVWLNESTPLAAARLLLGR